MGFLERAGRWTAPRGLDARGPGGPVQSVARHTLSGCRLYPTGDAAVYPMTSCAKRQRLGAVPRNRHARARRISPPGRTRSALGTRRSALGARHSALGTRRSALGARQDFARSEHPAPGLGVPLPVRGSRGSRLRMQRVGPGGPRSNRPMGTSVMRGRGVSAPRGATKPGIGAPVFTPSEMLRGTAAAEDAPRRSVRDRRGPAEPRRPPRAPAAPIGFSPGSDPGSRSPGAPRTRQPAPGS
jgi:hypothetical protein